MPLTGVINYVFCIYLYNYNVRIHDGVKVRIQVGIMSLFRVTLGSQFPTVDMPFVTDCRPLAATTPYAMHSTTIAK